jgi:hypothetical protein
VGTVTTQLPNEEIKNWTVTAPGYEQNIEMVARAPAATYVYRPTYTAPPVYYSPWPYYSNVVYYWP